MGCVSGVVLVISQISVVPSRGVSLIGSSQHVLLIKPTTGLPVIGSSTSVRVRWRTRETADGSMRVESGLSFAGRLLASAPDAGTTRKSITLPFDEGSGRVPSGNGALASLVRSRGAPAGRLGKTTS